VDYVLRKEHALIFRSKKNAIITYILVSIILFTSSVDLDMLFRLHALYSTERHYEYLNVS